jgi:hypothetical protein
VDTALLPFTLDDPLVRGANLRNRLDIAVGHLAADLAAGQTAGFKEVLGFYSRFWTYSVRNCLLIHGQLPTATRCAGRTLWNRLGYHIRRGEHAIWIWAPILQRAVDPDDGDERTMLIGFRPAAVFDASQLAEIEERPLPPILPVQPDDHEAEFQRAVAKIAAHGIRVVIQPLLSGATGTSSGGLIRIAPGLDSRNRLIVLFHELTHELWHHQELAFDPDRSRAQLEFEAEAVAYVVASVLGIAHPSARDYLLQWEATPELLHRSLVTIQSMVRRVLVILEIPFDVLDVPEALVDQ